MPGWQVLAARATHLFFYVAMIALTLTGWLTASASPLRFPLVYFGMFQLPFLPVEQSRGATGLWSEAAEQLAFTTFAVIGLQEQRHFGYGKSGSVRLVVVGRHFINKSNTTKPK